MTDIIETIEYRGHKIHKCYDQDPLNPRKDWDHAGTMACFHKRYDLGDEDHGLVAGEFEGWDDMLDHLYNKMDAVVVLPLYLYDHGGITMSTGGFSCGWDSGQVGFIFMDTKAVKEAFGKVNENTIVDARALLEAEVKEYDMYLTGQVYGYWIEGPNCDDSCWGYFGDDEYMIQEAKGNIDDDIKQLELQLGQ